ncbi:DUF1491 family protein [Sphingomonas sp. NSE70-1]|uniref:DUF1491 family protein n=1 Tax=Sphingomonas caseinilyticus TaxID=2908205 RepID=A0ABT0RUV9_9SPHN|nr:DUF1491 family protein [Sphingomonas caseinilyticus]MCL6698810.1 DUF1491 family protein [Sphingomonas caseinilyticus]
MAERLPAHLEAAGFIRQAEAEGGFGTIIKRGDADRGALILLIASRGQHQACLERALGPDGIYGWQRSGPPVGADSQSLADWSEKRLRFDEDSWLIELDIPDPQRLIVEMGAKG